ncbi:hypothetical protein HD599_002383 [Conyzicola lurida]|uniref:Uncharacterized protein n=1 Tax=Conyzicola lurida TaxID=1172621 RepID=A0A841AJH9_9MICO|nr:hypothetical protein [Conyzicola lurida]MBB5844060.1 hypothetical protein [Conyzicola lurida]
MLLFIALPDVYTPRVLLLQLLTVVAFMSPVVAVFVVRRRRIVPAERTARRLSNTFVVAPTPGLKDHLEPFSLRGAPPQRPFPIQADDDGLRFLSVDGAIAFATIPWNAIERIDGGDALRIVLDEDTNVLLQPMGRIKQLGLRRVRALAERLRALRP